MEAADALRAAACLAPGDPAVWTHVGVALAGAEQSLRAPEVG